MEEWKDVLGYEGLYQVSDEGRIRSICRQGNALPGIRKPSLDKDGYLQIGLYDNGECRKWKVHRLVATTFIPNPFSKPQVNHINGIKTDNRVENLEWVSDKDNKAHAIKNGYYDEAHKSRALAITARNIENGETVVFDSMTVASKTLGISLNYISDLIKRKHGTNIGKGYEFDLVERIKDGEEIS